MLVPLRMEKPTTRALEMMTLNILGGVAESPTMCLLSDDKPIIISGDNSEDNKEVEELSGSELEELMGRQLKTPEVNTYSKIMHQ